MPLAEQASKAGINMEYQNVDVPQVRAKFGGGYVGAQLEPQGRALGEEAVREFGLKAGDIINIGFDTSPQIVQAFKDGWVQLTSDQQPFLQGYMPVLSLCQQVVYGLGAINVDTGAGFVTPDNYEAVAALAIEGLR
jgi:simple sugar transport system substrate-binding protein